MSNRNNSGMFTLLASILIALCLLVIQPPVRAQENYTPEEYKAYEEINAESTAAKKMALIVQFLKQNPKSGLRQHVIAAYYGIVKELEAGQRWSQAISFGEQFLGVVPDDQVTYSLLTMAYQRTNNDKQFVVFGEKAFERSPNGALAYALAKAYRDMGNTAKFVQWGEKTVGFMPDNLEVLLDLTKTFGMMRRNAEAAKYARQTLKAAQGASKPAATDEKVWKDFTNNLYATCYGVIGTAAYEARDYATAITNLENSLKFFKRSELAYYYLGLSYWQQNKIDMAMLNLAKAYLFGGSSAQAAKQNLDNLYRSTHKQSLAGQERVIARAKEELSK
jgi:tetratricopeptide (TPR) repeat protein